jgi:hypothetical protein
MHVHGHDPAPEIWEISTFTAASIQAEAATTILFN